MHTSDYPLTEPNTRAEGTGMEEEVDQDRQRFAYFWTNHVRPLLEDALGSKKVPQGTAFQSFLRAVSYSNSRGFYVDERHGEAMVPFADLFNHKCAYTPLEYEVWTQGDDDDDDETVKEIPMDELDVDEVIIYIYYSIYSILPTSK